MIIPKTINPFESCQILSVFVKVGSHIQLADKSIYKFQPKYPVSVGLDITFKNESTEVLENLQYSTRVTSTKGRYLVNINSPLT